MFIVNSDVMLRIKEQDVSAAPVPALLGSQLGGDVILCQESLIIKCKYLLYASSVNTFTSFLAVGLDLYE